MRTAIIGLALLVATATLANGRLDVKEYGAVGDGTTDDTASIQAALDAAAKVHGVAYLPTGRYRITDALQVPAYATLLGEGDRWENAGVQIIVEEPNDSALVLGDFSCAKGLYINYPNNLDNSAPIEYPPAIVLGGIDPSVENIHLNGAWTAISTGRWATNAGQALLRNITGFVHNVGVHLDGPLDIVRIENVHWFVGGDGSSGNWFRQNRVGFQFGRVDGVMMDKCFMIGGKTFVHQLRASAVEGQRIGAHSLPLMFSQCWVENVQSGFIFESACGISISDTHILVNSSEGCGIRVDAGSLYYGGFIENVQVRTMPGVTSTGIYCSFSVPHPRNQLLISNCQIIAGAPAIHLGPGARRVLVTNSHLIGANGQPAVLVDNGADLFAIRGNVLSAEKPIRDLSAPDARKVIKDNLLEP